MIRYQRVRITTGEYVGFPKPLPEELVGLSDTSLANLSWVDPALGYADAGFLPVEVEDPPPPLPEAIPMHRAKKAMAILGPEGPNDDTKWLDMVQAAIDAVPNAVQKRCIQIEFDTAPNLLLHGATTVMIMAAVGMTADQRDAMATYALTLP